jgi:ribonuclease P protein subunit POP4
MKEIDHITQNYIGKQIKVINSSCPSLIGMEGKIVDETKHTFKITLNNELKKLNKTQISFKINQNNYVIDGKKIIKQPWERLKLRIKNE